MNSETLNSIDSCKIIYRQVKKFSLKGIWETVFHFSKGKKDQNLLLHLYFQTFQLYELFELNFSIIKDIILNDL